MDRIWKLSLLITGLILLDQFTKGVVQSSFILGESVSVIPNFFNLTYVRNPGAAFGFLGTVHDAIRKPVLLGLPVVACIWLISLIWMGRNKSLLPILAYSLILSGAIGNLIDRISLGYVVDFLDFYVGKEHFPAFNVADSAITIGGVLIFIDAIKEYKEQKESKEVKE